MADYLLYHSSDEDYDEDALLERAFDRWEQLGGGSARGPLFEFHMQPIGRRRRLRDVVERAQFNAQLRQLRDPVAGDNIGMALTEALHHAIEAELDREQSLSWLSPLLSQQASQALCCTGQKRGGTVSSHSIQTHGSAQSGLHSHRNMRV